LSESVSIKYNIAIALLLSALVHVLIFYVPNQLVTNVGQSATESIRVEVQLVEPEKPAAQPVPTIDTAALQNERQVAAEGGQLPAAEKRASRQPIQPLPAHQQADGTEPAVEQSLAINREDAVAGTQQEHQQLLQLIYMEINKHKHYPYIAKRQGREGLVKLNFVMHPDGEVTDIAIVETSHFAVLDNAARHAVQAISPFRVAAEYLDSYHRYDVNIDFRLN